MGSPEHPNWFLDCPLIDDMPVPGTDFAPPTSGFNRNPQGFNPYPDVRGEINGSIANFDGHKEPGSQKRMRSESCSGPSSKACREKMRRDRLNERFVELSSILDPGKPPKMDKATILSDAMHMVTQLRTEAQKFKQSNESLEEKIKELKMLKLFGLMHDGPDFVESFDISPLKSSVPLGKLHGAWEGMIVLLGG